MEPSSPLSYPFAARQERLLHLDAGTELRCRSGRLLLRMDGPAGAGASGVTLALACGQALRVPVAQWVTIAAAEDSRAEIQPGDTQPAMPPAGWPEQAQKNRQGLAGLWRWCVERLPVLVRRGTRAA